jgi:hypothetical protein
VDKAVLEFFKGNSQAADGNLEEAIQYVRRDLSQEVCLTLDVLQTDCEEVNCKEGKFFTTAEENHCFGY